jgi:hypothetical protein
MLLHLQEKRIIYFRKAVPYAKPNVLEEVIHSGRALLTAFSIFYGLLAEPGINSECIFSILLYNQLLPS